MEDVFSIITSDKRFQLLLLELFLSDAFIVKAELRAVKSVKGH